MIRPCIQVAFDGVPFVGAPSGIVTSLLSSTVALSFVVAPFLGGASSLHVAEDEDAWAPVGGVLARISVAMGASSEAVSEGVEHNGCSVILL